MPLNFDVTLVFREIPRAHVQTKLNPNKGSPAGAEIAALSVAPA